MSMQYRKFILTTTKYVNVDLPYIKAGDHLFIVVAKVNDYPLITWDKVMYNKAKETGVKVYTPREYLNEGFLLSSVTTFVP